jgi:3-dehydroquinate synthase
MDRPAALFFSSLANRVAPRQRAEPRAAAAGYNGNKRSNKGEVRSRVPPDLSSPPTREVVHVELGSRSYDIEIVAGETEAFGGFARRALGASWSGRGCRRALIVTDENVAAVAPAYAAALAGVEIAATIAVVPPGEVSKSLDRAVDLYDDLVRMKGDRHTAIVALGGGVVGDLAGFVAATYVRGVPLLMVPTTMLAQVDSSVGGKVGINHPRVKNIIGAFHQPSGVWIDTSALSTLPARELRSGLAEVVKHAAILDPEFFAELETQVQAVLGLVPRQVRRTVAWSCRLKAGIVAQDEREETGCRAVLNFGHTVGHAIEAVAGFAGPYRHGEAVAIGMVAECRLAERLGWIDRAVTDRLAALLRAFGLPTSAAGLDRVALRDAMARDKKNRGGRIRFVLPRAIGRVELTDAPTEADVFAALASIG